MKTQVFKTNENTEVRGHFIDIHNSRRLQWNNYRRYTFTL